jgi:hypothetical protein
MFHKVTRYKTIFTWKENIKFTNNTHKKKAIKLKFYVKQRFLGGKLKSSFVHSLRYRLHCNGVPHDVVV